MPAVLIHLWNQLRQAVGSSLVTAELAVLRRIIWLNRNARRVRIWVVPVQRWLWLLPVSYAAGLAGGAWLFTH